MSDQNQEQPSVTAAIAMLGGVFGAIVALVVVFTHHWSLLGDLFAIVFITLAVAAVWLVIVAIGRVLFGIGQLGYRGYRHFR